MLNRRHFAKQCAAAGAAAVGAALGVGSASARSETNAAMLIETPTLSISYEQSGASSGFPIILLHGFPDDVRAWDGVIPPLAKAGYRVLAPYLRGYGPTRFRDAAAPRMGEQAAIGQDLIDFADALHIERVSQKIAARCAVYCGKRGLRAGTSAMKLSTAPPPHSIIPILWMS